jgi:hypothetical protein
VKYKNPWVQFQTNIIEQLNNRLSLLTYRSIIHITFSSTMKFSYIALLATGYALHSYAPFLLSPKLTQNQRRRRTPCPASIALWYTCRPKLPYAAIPYSPLQ